MKNESGVHIPVPELLAWYKLKPQTEGWNAILAYDKASTNKLLLQEYIERQTTAEQMPPMTLELMHGALDVSKEYLFNYVFDSPRLSFQRANINLSEAKMTCKVIDGIKVTFEEGTYAWDVVTLGSHSPLTAPPLTSTIMLQQWTGTVTDKGRVVLDISAGVDFKMYDGDEDHVRTSLGTLIQAEFAKLPAEQRQYELNILKISPDDYLKPEEFHLRTHTVPAAQIRGADEYGDGQVLVFVTMKGEVNGKIPAKNEDMKYLIPSGYSATLVLGHLFMLDKIISEGCKAIINAANDYEIVKDMPEGGFARKLTVKNGVRRLANPGEATDLPHFSSAKLMELVLGLGKAFVDVAPGDSSFEIAFDSGTLVIKWEGKKQQPIQITPKGGTLYQNNIGTHWRMMKRFTFELLPSGDLRMVLDPNFNELLTRVTPELFIGIPEVSQYFAEIAQYVEVKLVAELEAGMTAFLKQSEVIDQFRLNNLLFRSEQPVKLDQVHFPGDFVSFGEVGPTKIKFSIADDQLEPYVGVGKTIPFKVEPEDVTGVTWSVESIGEEGVDIGQINETTGLYTAPKTIPGRHLRVRVKATQGGNTSVGLISVLAFEVDISPQIRLIVAGSKHGRELRAGTLEAGDLTWTVVNGDTTGSRVIPSTEEDGDHTYFVGPQDTSKFFSVDEIKVTTAQAPFKTQSSYVVVGHDDFKEPLKIIDTPGLPENKVQLAVIVRGEPDNPSYYSWDVPIGGGTVDATGLVTLDLSSSLPFVVVTVIYTERPGRESIGALIIPIPMFTYPDAMRLIKKA